MANFIIPPANPTELLAFLSQDASEQGNLSIRGVARMAGVHQSSISKGDGFESSSLAEKLVAHGFDATALCRDGLPPQAVILVLEYFAYESKRKSIKAEKAYCELMGIPFREIVAKQLTRVSHRTEYEICRTFDSPYTEFEVKTPMGNIDILTPRSVVEVKTIKSCHNALGQVLSYGHYYPEHEKVILLFGKQTDLDVARLSEFKKVCRGFKVRCMSVNTAKNLETAKYELITKNLPQWEFQPQ